MYYFSMTIEEADPYISSMTMKIKFGQLNMLIQHTKIKINKDLKFDFHWYEVSTLNFHVQKIVDNYLDMF